MSDAIRAETVRIAGHDGDEIEAYLARPLAEERFGAVVVIHHFPGYDEETKEITRRFADHGYLALCPNLYSRQAPGASPEDAAAVVRAQGGIPDAQLVGDVDGAARYLKAMAGSNGKVGTIGYCSGDASRCWPRAASPSTPRSTATAPSSWWACPRACPSRPGPSPTWSSTSRARCSGCSGPRTRTPHPKRRIELEALLDRAPQDLRVPHLRGCRACLLRHQPAQLSARGRRGGVGQDLGLLRSLPVHLIEARGRSAQPEAATSTVSRAASSSRSRS